MMGGMVLGLMLDGLGHRGNQERDILVYGE